MCVFLCPAPEKSRELQHPQSWGDNRFVPKGDPWGQGQSIQSIQVGKETPKFVSAPCNEDFFFLRNKCSPLHGTPLLLLEEPGMIVPVSPDDSMDLWVGISSRSGEDMEEELIYKSPINPLLGFIPRPRGNGNSSARLCFIP